MTAGVQEPQVHVRRADMEEEEGEITSIPTSIPSSVSDEPSLAEALAAQLKRPRGADPEDVEEGGLRAAPRDDELLSNQARLPNGDVVTMREESWADTVITSKTLRRIGCDVLELGSDGYTIAKIIMAVEKIGDLAFQKPRNLQELLFVARTIKGRTRFVLMDLYSRLNAAQEDTTGRGDFRP